MIKNALFALLLTLEAMAALGQTPTPILGPLPVRDEFLLSAGYLALTPTGNDILPRDQWALDVRSASSNTFAVSSEISEVLVRQKQPSSWRAESLRQYSGNVFVVDGEMQRTTVEIRHGLEDGEVFVAVPIFSTNTDGSGKLIEGFHSEFGLGSDGRSAIAHDRKFVYLRNGQREVVRNWKDQIGLGDVTLGAKYALPPFASTALAIEVLAELPTGERSLFSSGSIDAGAILVASRRLEHSSIFANVGVARLGRNANLDIPDRSVISATVGYGRMITAATSATIQITGANSPFRGLSWPELGQNSYQIAAGIQHQIDSRQALHIALIENALHYRNSADFAVQVGISVMRP
jgi:hypothetical protein